MNASCFWRRWGYHSSRSGRIRVMALLGGCRTSKTLSVFSLGCLTGWTFLLSVPTLTSWVGQVFSLVKSKLLTEKTPITKRLNFEKWRETKPFCLLLSCWFSLYFLKEGGLSFEGCTWYPNNLARFCRRNLVSASDQFGHRLEPTSEGLLSLFSLLDAAEVGVFPGGVAATKCGTAVGRAW